MATRNAGPAISRASASRRPATSPRRTSRPVSSCRTDSATPPTSVATTGKAARMASRMLMGKRLEVGREYEDLRFHEQMVHVALRRQYADPSAKPERADLRVHMRFQLARLPPTASAIPCLANRKAPGAECCDPFAHAKRATITITGGWASIGRKRAKGSPLCRYAPPPAPLPGRRRIAAPTLARTRIR